MLSRRHTFSVLRRVGALTVLSAMLALLGLVAASQFLSAGQEAAAQDSTVVVPRGQPIQIAVVVDLPGGEGPFPDFGEGAANAVQMAIEDHRPKFVRGFRIQQNNFDEDCDPTSGEAAANAVVANLQNVGVIGHLCSVGYSAGLPIYESARVVTISGSATQLSSLLWPQGPNVLNRTVTDCVADCDDWLANVDALPTVLAWREDYEVRFGSSPPDFAEHYYDATHLLLTRIHEVAYVDRGNLVIDREELADAVRDTEDFLGVTCLITLDEFGTRIDDIEQLLPCAD